MDTNPFFFLSAIPPGLRRFTANDLSAYFSQRVPEIPKADFAYCWNWLKKHRYISFVPIGGAPSNYFELGPEKPGKFLIHERHLLRLPADFAVCDSADINLIWEDGDIQPVNLRIHHFQDPAEYPEAPVAISVWTTAGMEMVSTVMGSVGTAQTWQRFLSFEAVQCIEPDPEFSGRPKWRLFLPESEDA